jgi:putative membrane protein
MTARGTRVLVLLASVAGLAVAAWAFGRAGVGEVLEATGRIGLGGFLVFCAYSLGVSVLLGAAWLASAPDTPLSRLGLFTWARIVREGVADLLPFTQVGGLIVGARTLAARGIALPLAFGSMIVDMTTEMTAQLVFTLFGLAMFVVLVWAAPDAGGLLPLILGGTGMMAVLIAALLLTQRHAASLANRLGMLAPARSLVAVERLAAELRRLYGRRDRVAAAFLFNGAAWVASALGAWLALRLMGIAVPVWSVLTVESLIFTVRSVAFAIPGAIGVQEASYVLLAPLLGLPPTAVLALSLVKRARDVAIGLPAVLAWQAQEARAVVRVGQQGDAG